MDGGLVYFLELCVRLPTVSYCAVVDGCKANHREKSPFQFAPRLSAWGCSPLLSLACSGVDRTCSAGRTVCLIDFRASRYTVKYHKIIPAIDSLLCGEGWSYKDGVLLKDYRFYSISQEKTA